MRAKNIKSEHLSSACQSRKNNFVAIGGIVAFAFVKALAIFR